MKKEDIEFLKDLQHELLTQTNDRNADPVYWGVMETIKIPSPDEYESPLIYNSDEGETCSVDYLVEILEEEYNDGMTDNEKSEFDKLDKTSYEEVCDFANDYFGTDSYQIVYEVDHDQLSTQTGAFLTKRAAKEYIEKYSYNHSKPRTFAMTAYRNFEFGHLIDILKNINFDDIKETE